MCVCIHIYPAGRITGPWFQENDVFAIAACMVHVQNDHDKKSLNSDGLLTRTGFCVQKGCELKSRLFHSIKSWRPVFERSWHVPISQRHCWILMYFHSFGFGFPAQWLLHQSPVGIQGSSVNPDVTTSFDVSPHTEDIFAMVALSQQHFVLLAHPL